MGRGRSGMPKVDTSVARRMSKEEAQSLLTTKVAEPLVDAGKPTKYSEQLFAQTYREARQYANNGYGSDGVGAFSTMLNEGQSLPSMQALKGVQSLINSEKREIELDVRLGVFSVDDANKRLRALNIVQGTLNNDVRFVRE